MNTIAFCFFMNVVLFLLGSSAWGNECRFFRIACLDTDVPENVAITKAASGEIFLEFDTGVLRDYEIQVTDDLCRPEWRTVARAKGDGARVRILTRPEWGQGFGKATGDPKHTAYTTSGGEDAPTASSIERNQILKPHRVRGTLSTVSHLEAAGDSCPPGMISYWKLDEGSGGTSSDQTGVNPGSVMGATWAEGMVQAALSFDGSDLPHPDPVDLLAHGVPEMPMKG